MTGYTQLQDLDKMRCILYDEFYKDNNDLFRRDGLVYWNQARFFVEPALRIWMITGKKPALRETGDMKKKIVDLLLNNNVDALLAKINEE